MRIPLLGFVTSALIALLVGAVHANEDNLDVINSRTPSGFLIERLRLGETLGLAENGSARELNPASMGLIKVFEGWVPNPYDDPAGYCTIGYGHLIALKTCDRLDVKGYLTSIGFSDPLTDENGEELLRRDTSGARITVMNHVKVDLNSDQFGSLTSFIFNVGEGNFRKSTLLKLLNTGDYQGAADQLPRWARAGGRILPGLQARRACEKALFNSKVKLAADGSFQRSSCESLGAEPVITDFLDVDVKDP